MEQSEFLNALTCPAFFVENGQVVQANIPALQRNIEIGAAIANYICVGLEEYQEFTQGKLSLSLKISGINYPACVSVTEKGQLFSLETEYQEPELKAFSLAATQLREPLANVMTEAELLGRNIKDNDDALAQLSQINRNLNRLLRAISNMSDASLYQTQQAERLQTENITSVFSEILEKALVLTEKTERELICNLPDSRILTLVDRQKLERAVLNLLSNAIKYSPAGSKINTDLTQIGKRLYFTVENTLSGELAKNPFSRYLREPGLENGQSGVGLGLSIVRSVAASHGGVLLMQQLPENKIRFTLTIAIRNQANLSLHSPVILPVDYAGGRDQALLELSDVLPDSLFQEFN